LIVSFSIAGGVELIGHAIAFVWTGDLGLEGLTGQLAEELQRKLGLFWILKCFRVFLMNPSVSRTPCGY
jgi:hypothetical protein